MTEDGCRQQPTPLDYLHRYWRQVSPEDRLRFLVEMLTPTERLLLQSGLWPDTLDDVTREAEAASGIPPRAPAS